MRHAAVLERGNHGGTVEHNHAPARLEPRTEWRVGADAPARHSACLGLRTKPCQPAAQARVSPSLAGAAGWQSRVLSRSPYLTFSNSTSKINVALAGITRPAPRSP